MAKNILVAMISGIGDHIYAMALPAALRKANPNSKIIVLTKEQSRDLFENNKYVDEVIVMNYESKSRKVDFKTILALRRAKIDIAYFLDSKNRALIYLLFGGCKKIVSLTLIQPTKFVKLFADELIIYQNDHSKSHALDKFIHHAEKITGIKSDYVPYAGEIRETSRTKALEIIVDFKKNMPEFKKMVAICMGVQGPDRLWDVQKCSEIIRRNTSKGWLSYFVGGAADYVYSQSIIDASGCYVPNFCGKASLDDIKALFQYTDAMLSLDTGPAHVAGACGVAVAVIAKTAHPRNWGVYSDRYIAIRDFGSPTFDPDMDISVEDVELALDALIRMGRKPVEV